MKKIFVFLALLIISSMSIQLFSQSLSIGLKGGASFSNMLEESDLAEFSEIYKFLPGYNAGLYFEAAASEDLIGEAGIGLATFGYQFKTEGQQVIGGAEGQLKSNFLLIPLKAKTVKDLGFLSVFASGGVYAGIGLSGIIEVEADYGEGVVKNTEDIRWGTDPEEHDMTRFDYGVVGSAGLNIKGVILELGYYHGFANLSAYTEENYVMSNRAFYVSLGYSYSFNKFEGSGY